VDADCAPDKCVNGQCGGCTNSSDCHDNAFAASCGGIPAGNYGTCSVFNKGVFPEACRQGPLTAQEKALEFMFFDLTACVSPDNLPPPPPTANVIYNPATFIEDFSATCPKGTSPVWREFNWQAQIPSGATISFVAQSGDDADNLLPATPLPLATATASTATGPANLNYDAALLDTGRTGPGVFTTANPVVVSKNLLRISITMKPTLDLQQTPTLLQWKVQYDCSPSE